ncbi:MAG: phosphotransferase [Thermomicrobiales bacterium]
MREPPGDLADATLRACLGDHYGVFVTQLDFLPLGHDTSAWVYRVRAEDGRVYFLNVRRSVTNEAGLVAPRYLYETGITQIAAPLLTTTGALWAATDDYAFILYPFVAGVTGMAHGMTDQQWRAYGALLHQVHATTVTSALARLMRRDTFTPNGADLLRRLDAHIGAHRFADPAAQALATFWQARRADIHLLLDRAEALGRRLAATEPAFVLCHADIHTNNVLLDDEGRVWFVDWDDTILAPRERDLMFVVGGLRRELVGPREEALFFQGYGATSVNALALAYYRYARAVSDLADEGEPVFFRPDLGLDTRREAVERVTRLFKPGYLVALAFAAGDPAV